jgi:hypothetical protein
MGGGKHMNASSGAHPRSKYKEMAAARAYMTIAKSIAKGESATKMVGYKSVRKSSTAAQNAANGHG